MFPKGDVLLFYNGLTVNLKSCGFYALSLNLYMIAFRMLLCLCVCVRWTHRKWLSGDLFIVGPFYFLLLFAYLQSPEKRWTTADSAASEEHCNFALYLEAGKHVCISENCCLLQWINPFLSIVKGNRDRLCHMFLCDSHFLSIGDNLCSLERNGFVSPWFTDSYFGSSFHHTLSKMYVEIIIVLTW